MIKIVIVTKPDCIACDIAKKVISEAILMIDKDFTFVSITGDETLNENLKVDIYPTTIFYRETKGIIEKATHGSFREIARLTGSFPIDYLVKIIDKLKLEQ